MRAPVQVLVLPQVQEQVLVPPQASALGQVAGLALVLGQDQTAESPGHTPDAQAAVVALALVLAQGWGSVPVQGSPACWCRCLAEHRYRCPAANPRH